MRRFENAVLLGLFCWGTAATTIGCTSGTRWVNAPLTERHRDRGVRLPDTTQRVSAPSMEDSRTRKLGAQRAVINQGPRPLQADELPDARGERPELRLEGTRPVADGPVDGRLLGNFRNTYYDFPAEFNFDGSSTVPLMDRSCKPISSVARDFYEAVCVQGSGTLRTGVTVSFAKRDCDCATTCPRTGQKICFDALDQQQFPWGRGATGRAITPLLSIAVDSDFIPLGTKVYILEFDGVPRRPGGAPHDGCFIAEDRGMKVRGRHVDVFTGNPSITEHFNELVPSNQGVHVYANTARCDAL